MFTLEVMLAIDMSLNSSRGLHFSAFKLAFLPLPFFIVLGFVMVLGWI